MVTFDFKHTYGNCFHYPDLAEIRANSINGNEDISSIPTEFVFCTTGTNVEDNRVNNILKLGFKEVGAMKNWHWIHHNEWTKPIRLFWKRVHSKRDAKPVETLNPNHFSISSENTTPYHKAQREFLQWNGCGMKVGDKLKRDTFYRYFGLLRLPLKQSPRMLRWLKYANYRLIATGKLATFWNNGWKSQDDWSVQKEQEFWRKRGICWKEETDFTYTNLTPKQRTLYTPKLRIKLREHIMFGGDPHKPFMDFNVCPFPTAEQAGGSMIYAGAGQYKFQPNLKYKLAGGV